jgi:hypothetical protein
MPRLVLFLLLAVLALGCSKRASPTIAPPPSPPAEVKLPTTPGVAKKVYTRTELEAWALGVDGTKSAFLKYPGKVDVMHTLKSAEDVKLKLGQPASTTTKGGDLYDELVYVYYGVSIDADGSGNIDSRTKFTFYSDLGPAPCARVEFIP